MSLYFAYGSNMDQNQMKERCPNAVLVGSAVLKEYRLAFTIFSPKRQCGCADIISSLGDTVYGLLYELSDDELMAMDVFEGHPIHYRRTTVEITLGEKIVSVYTYEVVNKTEGVRPSAHYLGLIRTAANAFNLSPAYCAFLATIETEG